MSREKHFPHFPFPFYFETQILFSLGCRASPLHCMWSSPATVFCAAAATAGACPGSDNTNTIPAHSNPAWKSGQHSLEVCAQEENNLAVMATAGAWTCTKALLSFQDHFGSWVFLTMVTLQFIPLLKTKIQIIPFKLPTPAAFRTITTGYHGCKMWFSSQN